MASRKRQHEELSDDSEADTVILTDDEETDIESDDEIDESEAAVNLLKLFSLYEIGDQVCEDVKKGMSQDEVVSKYKSKYLDAIDESMEDVVQKYEKLRKLKIFIHMCDTNDHLEQIRGDTDEYWVEAYNIHKKKFLHPQLDPYIIRVIRNCAALQEKENVSDGYTSKYFRK